MRKSISLFVSTLLISSSLEAVRFSDKEALKEGVAMASNKKKTQYKSTACILKVTDKEIQGRGTGVAINPTTILTTAHSWQGEEAKNWFVYTGSKIEDDQVRNSGISIKEIVYHPDFNMTQENPKPYPYNKKTIQLFDIRFPNACTSINKTAYRFSGPDLAILKLNKELPVKSFLTKWEGDFGSIKDATLISYGQLGTNGENIENYAPIQKHVGVVTPGYSEEFNVLYNTYNSFKGTRDSFIKDKNKHRLQYLSLEGDSGAPLIKKMEDENFSLVGIQSRYLHIQGVELNLNNFDVITPITSGVWNWIKKETSKEKEIAED